MIYLINFADEKLKYLQYINTWFGKKRGKIDEVFEYSPKDIDKNFYEMNKNIFSIQKGYGLYIWKPYIVNKTMEKIKYGDIILYMDVGASLVKDFRSVAHLLEEQDIWCCELPLIEKQFTKKEALIDMDAYRESIYESNQIHASYFAIKKNIQTEKFCKEWLQYAQNIEILDDREYTDQVFSELKFHTHRCDQSIFSVLCKKYGYHSSRDRSQFGVYEELYLYNKEFIFSKSKKQLSLPLIIVHHRVHKTKIKGLLQSMCLFLFHDERFKEHYIARLKRKGWYWLEI